MPKKNDNVNSRNKFHAYWEKSFEGFKDRLTATALKLANGVVHDAEDLVMETYLRICMYPKDPKEIRNPFGYLKTIMRHVWNTNWRKKGAPIMLSLDELLSKEAGQKQRRSVEPAVESDVLRILQNEELWDELQANQGPLTPREKLLLALHLDGYTCQEIADSLGEDVHLVSVELNAIRIKVKNRLKRARALKLS